MSGPKEGDVVLVPGGMPYFVTKRAERKKGIRKLEKKKKRITGKLEPEMIGGEEVYVSKEEEQEIKEWERSLREENEEKEAKKSKKRKVRKVEDIPLFGEDGDEDRDPGDDDDRGAEEDEDQPEDEGYGMDEEDRPEEGEEEEEGEEGEARYEVLEDLVYKKVKIPAGQRDYTSKYGINLPDYEFKLLPQKVRRRIRETEMRYPIHQRMRVGADGELIPIVEDEPRPIKMVGEDIVPKPGPDFSPPRKAVPRANPYNSKYPFGAYVSFTEYGEMVKGVVLSFSKWGVNVSVKGRIYQIDYTDKSLQLASKTPVMRETKKKDVTVEDVYATGEIPEIFRTLIVDSYISILKNINKNLEIKPKSQINTSFFQHPPLTWEEYYSKEFRSWIYAKYYAQFLDELDELEINQQARKIEDMESSVDGLLSQVIELLPRGLWYDTTINEVLEVLKEQTNITVFQAHLIIALEKEIIAGGGGYQKYMTTYTTASGKVKGPVVEKYYRQPGKPAILRLTPPQVEIQESVEVKPIAGKDLAVILKNAIESYQRIYKSDFNTIRDSLISVSLGEKLNEYQPTDEDRAEFEAENIVNLTNMHIEAEQTYYREKKRLEAEIRAQEEQEDRSTRELRDIEDQVKRFEQLMFAAHGSSVHTYLSNVLIPYIFLDGPLARHAKFFRSKLEIGEFRFDDLGGINLAHYLPELAMNEDITETQWVQARNILSSLLDDAMDNLINLYITIHNPMTKIEYRSNVGKTMGLINPLVKLLKDPRDMCPQDSGYRPVVREGKYVYKPGSKELLKEKIPPGEMTICFSDGKFTCHEIKSVLRAISTSDQPINPMTMKPFPESFVQKMKTRYADALRDPDGLWKEAEEPSTPPEPKKRTPVKQKPLVPLKSSKTPKKVDAKPRHKPPRKAKGKVVKMAVIGDAFDTLTTFDTDFTVFVVSKEKIVQEPRIIPFTTDIDDPEVNVVVVGFDAKDISSLDAFKDMEIPNGVLVYVVGVDTTGLTSIAKTKMTRQAKKMFAGVQQVFYTNSMESEDLIGALKDVFIDVEAVNAF